MTTDSYTLKQYEATYDNEITDNITEIYHDDGNITIVCEITQTVDVEPRAGSQHIDSETSLLGGANYTKYCYDEIYSVDLGKAYANLVFSAFILIITLKWPFISAPLAVVLEGVKLYFAHMQEKRSTYQYAYIKTSVYTTPTISNPPYQYFKYYSYYYADKVSGELKFLITSDISYGALVPGI